MNNKGELPKYSLFVHRNDLFALGNPISNELVTGQLNINNIKYEIGIKFRGHHTRNLPKKSYFIQLFNFERLLGAREFHLNAEFNDPSFIRNKLSLDLFQSFGVLVPMSQHILLYLNDQYEGVYLQLEAVDDLFLKNRGLPSGALYYAINNNANFSLLNPKTNTRKKILTQGYERKLGNYSDNLFLIEFIHKINSTLDNEFQLEICKYLDVDKYLRWLAVAVCTQNIDGFYHNYALYRNSETGLFEILPWDYDATFGRDWNGKIVKYDVLPLEGKNHLTKRLLQFPLFRKQYQEILQELLNTLFTPAYLESLIDTLTESIRPHLIMDSQKQLQQFNAEKQYMITFVKQRSQYIRKQLHSLKN